MTETKFTYGNLVILYCNNIKNKKDKKIPEYINERIKICIQVINRIKKSKPDGEMTSLVVVSDEYYGERIKEQISNTFDSSKIIIDSKSSKLSESLENVINNVKNKSNPPFIYVISAFWQKEILNLILDKFQSYRIQFEGAIDPRDILEINIERKRENPRKSFEHIKERAKNKTLDILLNYIFPDKK